MSKEKFMPIRLRPAPEEDSQSTTKITVSSTLKGSAADEFEAICRDYNLNRSQLVVQMVYHCLGKTNELRDFYRRLVILGE